MLLVRNINHLQLVEDSFGRLLTNLLPKCAIQEFVFRFLPEGECYFLLVLIELIGRTKPIIKKSGTAKELIEHLHLYYQENEQKALAICRCECSSEFSALYNRIAKRVAYN